MPADNLSDLANWHALVGDCVVLGSHGAFLKHECVEMSCIEAMLKPLLASTRPPSGPTVKT